jgi:hypothetical protein
MATVATARATVLETVLAAVEPTLARHGLC